MHPHIGKTRREEIKTSVKMTTYSEALLSLTKTRNKSREEEHRLQCACVRWFAVTHGDLAGRLIAIPNGGRRDKTTAAKLKAEGVTAGAADLALLVRTSRHGALFIEMKTADGRQSEAQKKWADTVRRGGYRYELCRSFEEFVSLVDGYIKEGKEAGNEI